MFRNIGYLRDMGVVWAICVQSCGNGSTFPAAGDCKRHNAELVWVLLNKICKIDLILLKLLKN